MKFKCINCSRRRSMPRHKFSRSCRCRTCGCKLFPDSRIVFRRFNQDVRKMVLLFSDACREVHALGITVEELSDAIKSLGYHCQEDINRRARAFHRNLVQQRIQSHAFPHIGVRKNYQMRRTD